MLFCGFWLRRYSGNQGNSWSKRRDTNRAGERIPATLKGRLPKSSFVLRRARNRGALRMQSKVVLKNVARLERRQFYLFGLVAAALLQVVYFAQFSVHGKDAAVCQSDPTDGVELVVSDYPTHELADFLKGPGIRSYLDGELIQDAVCEWYENSGTNHFPHELEQLYRCWSYWNTIKRTNNANASLVLYRDPNAGSFSVTDLYRVREFYLHHRNLEFVRGLLEVYQKLGITITDDKSVLSKSVRKGDQTVFGGYAYRWRSPTDARDLARFVTDTIGIPRTSGCRRNSTFPRLAILNRQANWKRSLLNADSIALQLQSQLAGLIHPDVPVEYFEGISFADQVAFYASTDLVISPHGAQLTGLPFLPECGAVLEIFPDNYYYQSFFGSLAEAAGIVQYTMYLSDDNANWNATIRERGKVRRKARQVNLCPLESKVVDAVNLMVTNWHKCCHHQ